MITTAPPGEGWKLVARRRITADKIYNAGCEIPVASVSQPQLRAMLNSGLVVWLPPSQPIAATPVDLPAPPPAPKKKPRNVGKVIVMHPDPVQRWHLTRLEARKFFDTDSATDDYLMSHPETREIYKLAAKVGVAEAKAKYKGRLQSISPNEIGL
jgi:hypothetical protein